MRLPIPTVPVSTQSQGQFSAPTAAPVQDFTAQQIQQAGASLLSAGATASRIGADLQADLDQGFLMESDAIASEITRNTVGKYRQLAGLPAIEQFEDMHEGLRAQLRNVGDTARSPEQKQRLERILAQRMQDASDSMASHRDGEIRNRAIGGAAAGVAAAVEDYRAALGNPEDMELARQLAIQRTGELSRLRGQDGDMARMSMLDTTTKLHVGAIDSLLASGAATEAIDYWNAHKGEVRADERVATEARVRAGFIDSYTRKLDQIEPSMEQRLAVVKRFEDEKVISGPEAESARRNLFQLANLRDAADARKAAEVETEVRQWYAQNPQLELGDNPDLARKATAYGVNVKRVPTTNPEFLKWFQTANEADPRMQQLRAMDPFQRRRFLGSVLNDEDRRLAMAHLDGDSSTVDIGGQVKLLAQTIGVMPKDDRATTEQTYNFLQWKATTIDPLIEAKRKELKVDKLTPAQVREHVINPLLADKVFVDTWGSDAAAKPLAQLQFEGAAPVDDPATPQDESLDLTKYQSLYVVANGEQVFLHEIPLRVRENIRTAWKLENPGVPLTAEREAIEWLRNGGKTSAMQQRAAQASPPPRTDLQRFMDEATKIQGFALPKKQ